MNLTILIIVAIMLFLYLVLIAIEKRVAQKTKHGGNENKKEKAEKTLRDIMLQYIDRSGLFRPECYDIVADHLTGKTNLKKEGQLLTAEEKKQIGINDRSGVTLQFINVFKSEVLNGINPSAEIQKIGHKAAGRLNIKNNLTKIQKEYRELNYPKKYYFIAPDDDRTCNWCKNINGKKFLTKEIKVAEILKTIDDNCACEWNRLAIVSDTSEYE